MAEYRRYEQYPEELIEAAAFRDQFDVLPECTFIALADELDLSDALVDLSEFEKGLAQ